MQYMSIMWTVMCMQVVCTDILGPNLICMEYGLKLQEI
jgi:hypothetical protein